MKRFLKISGIIFLLLLLLLAALIFSLPYLINLETVRTTVAHKLSERLKAEVQIKEASLHLFPRLALRVAGVRIENPAYGLFLEKGDLALRLLPLLKREAEVEKCLLTGLEFTLKEKKAQGGQKSFRSQAASQKIFLKTAEILEKLPEIRIQVKDGAFYRERKGQKILLLEGDKVFLAFKKDFLELEIKGKTLASKALKTSFKLWPQERLAEGLLQVKHLDLSKLPFDNQPLTSSLKTDLSLDLSFRFEEGKWHLGFTGTAPCILARKGKMPLLFDCSAVVGKATLAPQQIALDIKELVMKNPLLEAYGSFNWQPQKTEFDFQIARADWTEIRKRLLLFFDQNKGFRRFANIVEAGEAEEVHFKSAAPTPKKLFKLKNLSYEGKAKNAVLNLPRLNLRLTQAQGRVSLQKGLLEVKESQAFCENVFLHRADLSLDIPLLKKKKDSPFFFRTRFEGSFRGLKKILLRVPLPSSLNRELKSLSGKGTLKGRVKISGTLKRPKVSFDLHPGNLALKYPRFPLPLKVKGGSIGYLSKTVTLRGVRIQTPKSRLSGSAQIFLASHPWEIDLSEARGVLNLKETYQVLETFPGLSPYLERYRLEGNKITLIDASYRGPLTGKTFLKKASLKVSGKNLKFSCPRLPAPLLIEKGEIAYRDFRFSFGPSQLTFFDSLFELTGELGLKPFEIFLTGSGNFHQEFVSWIFEKGKLPQDFFPRLPLKASSFEFEWNQNHLRFAGKLEISSPSWASLIFEKKGPRWQLEGTLFPQGKETFKFKIVRKKKLSLALKGEIDHQVIKLFLARNPFLLKHLVTDLKGVLDLDNPARSYFFGTLEVSRFRIPDARFPVWIESLALEGCEKKILIHHGEFDLNGTSLEAEGELFFSPRYLSFEGSAYSPSVVVEDLLAFIKRPSPEKNTAPKSPPPKPGSKLELVVRLDLEADSVIYRNYEFSPFKGTLFYHPGSLKLVVTESYLCDIQFRGSFEKNEEGKSLELSFLEPEGRFEKALFCLFHKKDLKGPFELKGDLITHGRKKLFEKSSGQFHLRSREGHIYKFNALSKLFAILSPIDIFSGNLPDFSEKGMDYDLLEIKGKFKKDYLKIKALQLNAPGLRFFGTGKLYFREQKIDLTLLVSPFKAFNAVVSKVPLVGWVLTGKSKMLLAAPVRITGDLKDPTVIPLDPVSLGSQFLGIVGRTFKLPVKILTPPEKKNGKAP